MPNNKGSGGVVNVHIIDIPEQKSYLCVDLTKKHCISAISKDRYARFLPFDLVGGAAPHPIAAC